MDLIKKLKILKEPLPKFNPAYEDLTERERFREQIRITFSAAIVATFLATLALNADWIFFIKLILGSSALFAGIFLLLTAASLKYYNPRWIYDIFYASEKIRLISYDMAIDSFGIFLIGATSTFVSLHIFKFSNPVFLIFNLSVIGVVILVSVLLSLLNIYNDKRTYVLPSMKELATSRPNKIYRKK